MTAGKKVAAREEEAGNAPAAVAELNTCKALGRVLRRCGVAPRISCANTINE